MKLPSKSISGTPPIEHDRNELRVCHQRELNAPPDWRYEWLFPGEGTRRGRIRSVEIKDALQVSIETIEHLFMMGRFTPAGVQRAYQWNENNWAQLLDDIEAAFEEYRSTRHTETNDAPSVQFDPTAYFLGKIVLTSPEPGLFDIYDGMQRMLSLTIMLACIRDILEDADLSARVHAMICNTDGVPHLTYPGRDKTLTHEVQRLGATKSRPTSMPRSDVGRLFVQAKAFMHDRLKTWDQDDLEQFTHYVLNYAGIAVLQVASPRLARQIFVTTNKRGIALSEEDLFSGQLVDTCPDEDTASRVLAQYRATRLLMGDQFGKFMDAVAHLETGRDNRASSLADLASTLSQRKIDPERWTTLLNQKAHAWKQLDVIFDDPSKDPTGNHIWRLGLLKYDEWRPLGILWFEEYMRLARAQKNREPQHAKTLGQRMERLHKSYMTLTLADARPPERKSMVTRALHDINDGNDPLTNGLIPKLTVRRRAHRALNGQITKMVTLRQLIRWWESQLRGEASLVQAKAIKEASVEHILPQRPDDEPEWIAAFPDAAVRSASINMIGNMVACTTKANNGIGTQPFAKKLKTLKRHKKTFLTLQDILSETDWTPSLVEQRTAQMAADIWAALDNPAPEAING